MTLVLQILRALQIMLIYAFPQGLRLTSGFIGVILNLNKKLC